MTSQARPDEAPALTEQDLDENRVADYLCQNKDFFARFPGLLETIEVPHESGDAISLIERQIEVLREKNAQLNAQLNALLEVSHKNDETQQQLHQLTIEILAQTQINHALDTLARHLMNELTVDHIVIRLFADEQHPLPDIDEQYLILSHSAREALDELTPSMEPFCGRLKPSQLKRLFGKQADAVQSCVLVPLRRGILHGVIAMGSEDEHRFNPGMDTLYLKRLGEVVSAAFLRLTV